MPTNPDSIDVSLTTMAVIEASVDLADLMAEYEAESANSGIGPINPQWHTYRAMEAVGVLKAIAARVDGRLVGFMLLLVPELPHFGKVVGVSESFFVAAAHRHTGAGTRLRMAAEDAARATGAVGILMSAPTGGRLHQVLPRVGYRETNRTFFKEFT